MHLGAEDFYRFKQIYEICSLHSSGMCTFPVAPEVPQRSSVSDWVAVGVLRLCCTFAISHFLTYNSGSLSNLKSDSWLIVLILKYLKFESNIALLFKYLEIFRRNIFKTLPALLFLFFYALFSYHGDSALHTFVWGYIRILRGRYKTELIPDLWNLLLSSSLGMFENLEILKKSLK